MERVIWTSYRGATAGGQGNADAPSQECRVGGPAGAVQRGLRNLDILWPSFRVIVLEELVFDLIVVCSIDVKKILFLGSVTRHRKARVENNVAEEMKVDHGWSWSSRSLKHRYRTRGLHAFRRSFFTCCHWSLEAEKPI